MTRRIYLYFVLTFLLGIVAGGACLYMYGWYSGQWRRNRGPHHVVQLLEQRLDLSPSQTAQLTQIVDEMHAKQEAIGEQVKPQFQAIREEARTRVRAILNPQQVAKFNEMVKRWDERRKKHPHRLH